MATPALTSADGQLAPPAKSPSPSPSPSPQPTKILPTNSVTFENQTIRFRIDSSLAIFHVVQLVGITFDIDKKLAAKNYALRTVLEDELVTDHNLARIVEAKAALK